MKCPAQVSFLPPETDCPGCSSPKTMNLQSKADRQRQTVAIARALLRDPTLIMLDEPTAALGVAQTAEVLNLIERVRNRGHAVIMISHNMADVRAVADRIAVLGLGRNNGVFRAGASSEELVAAITGATENAVARGAGRRDGGVQ